MSERDRLMELIVDAENEIWREHQYTTAMARIDKIVDHLIAHNVTIPPVSVGQMIYLIRRPINHPAYIDECTIDRVLVDFFKSSKAIRFESYNFSANQSDIGKTVFLTREEAEEALREVKQ